MVFESDEERVQAVKRGEVSKQSQIPLRGEQAASETQNRALTIINIGSASSKREQFGQKQGFHHHGKVQSEHWTSDDHRELHVDWQRMTACAENE